jgi:TonB family protein
MKSTMDSTVLDAISVGRVIDGRFPLLQKLGGSEWSSAYLTDLDEGRPKKAAIKLFPFESVDAVATLAQWDVARTISHPHLMPLFHAGRVDVDGEDMLYVVTEYAAETLSQILPERPLTPEEVREMLGPVLDALIYLDRRCLSHGHLRPTNIMVVDDHLKLSPDFGWRARRRSIYDPPDADDGQPAPTADIWSLGILLVEALTQRPPAWNRLHDSEPEVPFTIPEPFFTIARECLHVDPARRCTLADIKGYLNPPRTAEPVDRSVKPSYKFRAIILTGSALILLLFIAAFIFGYDLTPSSPLPTPQSLNPATPAGLPKPSVSQPDKIPAPAAEAAHPQPVAHTGAHAPMPAREPVIGDVVKGSVAHQVLPEISEKILESIHGQVNVGVRVEVDLEGNVARAYIDSPGPSRFFANQALRAAQNWKFKPGHVGGHVSGGTWLLQFQFGQSEISVDPSEVYP